nr:MAG TPA: hypothetical protein [Caudoviricetes sp.]
MFTNILNLTLVIVNNNNHNIDYKICCGIILSTTITII